LVERNTELSGLTDQLKLSNEGRGEFVVVSGPTGCGKSALLEATSDIARARGMKVLTVEGRGPDEAVDVVDYARKLVRHIAGRMAAEDPRGLAEQMVSLADFVPTLIVVDDVHLADPNSCALLDELSNRIRDRPISVLLSTSRDKMARCRFLKGVPPVLLRSGKRWFTLEPLTASGLAELARFRLGFEPAADLVDELYSVTGGNLALAQGILDDILSVCGADQIAPVYGPAFHHAVNSNFLHNRACAQTAEAVRAIAILGSSCGPDRLSRTVDLEPLTLSRILDDLGASGVLSNGAELHPILRQVVLSATDDEELRRLRGRAAELLHSDGAPAEEVAEHLLANRAAPQPWAVSILCEAAEQAARGHRNQHAVALLRLALQSCGEDAARDDIHAQLFDAIWWVDPTAVSRRLSSLLESAREGRLSDKSLARLARRLAWLGFADEAEEALGLALGAAGNDTDIRIELAMSEFWVHHVFPGSAHATRRHGCELPPELFVGGFPWLCSARELPALLIAGKQDALALRAEEILQQSRPDRAGLEAGQSALFSLLAAERFAPDKPWFEALTRRSGVESTPQWSSMLSVASGVVSWWRGDLADAVRSVERALHLFDLRKWGAIAGLPRGLMLLAMTEQGRHQEVASELSLPLPMSCARSPYGLVYLRARGRHHLATGGLQAAFADFRSCGDILGSWGIELPGLVPWRLDLADTLLRLGEREEACAQVEEHLDTISAAPSRTRGIALRLQAMASPWPRRASGLREAATMLERSGDPLELARTLGELARTYQQTGELAYGRRVLRRAQKLARKCGAAWAFAEIPSATVYGSKVTTLAPRHAQVPDLTVAEEKVAELTVQGYTNREIADALYVTMSTVEQHLTHIYRKLGIRRRSELVAQASGL
jgi:DNA-binding CsgD family transcriptional regulator